MTTSDEEPRRRAASAAAPDDLTIPERPVAEGLFVSSPRGAQRARRFAVRGLAEWGFPAASDTSCTVALLVAELSANAVRHGAMPGRDRFHLTLSHDAAGGVIRIEVCDANPRRPPAEPACPAPEDESGRGLLLVDLLAARWGAAPRVPLGKTVWAEVATVGTDAAAVPLRSPS